VVCEFNIAGERIRQNKNIGSLIRKIKEERKTGKFIDNDNQKRDLQQMRSCKQTSDILSPN